jgi:glucan-binding YG repeat protein
VVDEWDTFQEERESKRIEKSFDELVQMDNDSKNKIERIEEIDMIERKVRVQLSRDYQVAEVEVSGIQDDRDFVKEADWARSQAQGLLDSYTKAPVNTKPNEYVKAHQETKKPANGVYTEAHITTKFLKGKQVFYALKGLNEGKIDLDKLNNANGWDESNSIVFPKKY